MNSKLSGKSWSLQRSKWQNSADSIEDTFSIVKAGFDSFVNETDEIWETSKNKADKDDVLVSGFMPLDNGNRYFKNDLIKSLTNTSSSESTPSVTKLLEVVLQKTYGKMLGKYS